MPGGTPTPEDGPQGPSQEGGNPSESGPTPERPSGQPDRGGPVPPRIQEPHPATRPEELSEEELKAHLEEIYISTNSDEVRRLLDEYGLSDDARLSIRMQLLRGQYSEEEIVEHITALNQAVQSHPDLMEAATRQTEEQREAKRGEQARDEEESGDESRHESDDETREAGIEEDPEVRQQREAAEREAAKKEQERLYKEAEEAVRASQDAPLDVDKRKAAAEKIRKAQKHHAEGDEHGADYLQEGDPWAKLLTTFGVMLYLYIGMQYAVASFVQNSAGGSGKH